ncbi:MAG: acyl-ACP--UDP-N-acetylglucosamine O-acyltransferase [Akkermansia sp.]|nr:acyl-ACP--UDP-N-acetylglucosamine O-acyltransferase [Akkermansia sp.]
MADIHPTAIVDPTAELADDVKVGPYCIIGPHVELGAGCVLHSHVVIDGPSRFGKGNEFYPFAAIGTKTQDLKYKGEPTFLEVGDYNVFRENCNINRSTTPETKTIIGSYNNFLINSHCGHEVHVGDHCILSGYAAAAGHCEIGNWVIISGCAALHQFVRVGDHALIGGYAKITQDVAPYMIAEGNPSAIRAINSVGLTRRGFSEEDIRALRFAYKKLFLHKGGNLQEKLDILLSDEKYGSNPHNKYIADFLLSSERGFVH